METIDNHIRELYSRREEIFSNRQQSFQIPLETLLKRSTSTKRTWIGIHEWHIKRLIIQKLDHTIKTLFEYKQHIPTTHHDLFLPPLEKLLKRPPIKKRLWIDQRKAIINALAQEYTTDLPTIHPFQTSDLVETSDLEDSPSTQNTSSQNASITSCAPNFYSSAKKLVTQFLESEKDTTD